MAYKKRKLEDLNVLDDFMFSAAASDEEVGKEFCRTVLSVLLQKELGEIQITAQKTNTGNAGDPYGRRGKRTPGGYTSVAECL